MIGVSETPSEPAVICLRAGPRLYYYYSANNSTVYIFNLKLKYYRRTARTPTILGFLS